MLAEADIIVQVAAGSQGNTFSLLREVCMCAHIETPSSSSSGEPWGLVCNWQTLKASPIEQRCFDRAALGIMLNHSRREMAAYSQLGLSSRSALDKRPGNIYMYVFELIEQADLQSKEILAQFLAFNHHGRTLAPHIPCSETATYTGLSLSSVGFRIIPRWS